MAKSTRCVRDKDYSEEEECQGYFSGGSMEEGGPEALCWSANLVQIDSGVAFTALAVVEAGGSVTWTFVPFEDNDGSRDKEPEEQGVGLVV